MDDGKGRLIPLPPVDGDNTKEIEGAIKRTVEALEKKHPDHGGWFKLDEIVVVKGSRFRVKRIKPTEIVLKLLPKKG